MLLLGIAAVLAAFQASQNAQEARGLAEAEAEARANAEKNADLAEAREFAASSIGVLDQDPELAVLLGVHAIQIAPDGDEPPPEARIALRQAVNSSFIKGRYPTGLDIRLGDVSQDGSRLVVTTDAMLTLFGIDPWEPMWMIDWDDLGFDTDAEGCLGEAWFASDSEIVIGFLDEVADDCPAEGNPDGDIINGVAILDSQNGSVLRSRLLGPCPASVVGPPSPVGDLLPVVRSHDADCERPEAEWTMDLLDFEELGTVHSFSVPSIGNPSWSSDAQRLSHSSYHGDGTTVFDTTTGEVLGDQVDGFFGQLSPDGSIVATSDLGTTVLLYDVETGSVVDRLHDVGDSPGWISFSEDGALIFAGGRGSATAVWNGIDGRLRALIPNTGPVSFLEYHDESQTLYHVGESDLTTWDLSVEVLGSRNSADLQTWVQGVVARGTRGVLLGMLQDHEWAPFLRTFDPMTGLIGDSTLDVEMGRPPSILPDGRVIAWPADRNTDVPMMGPVVAWNPDTSLLEPLVGCQVSMDEAFDNADVTCADGGEYFDFDRSFAWDDQVAVTSYASDDHPAQIFVYDAATLDPVDQIEAPFGVASIEQIGAGWVVGANLPTAVSSDAKEFTLYRLPSWEALTTVPASISQPSSDGRLLAVPVTGGPVRVLDTNSGDVVAELHAGNARVRGLAFSLDAGFQVGEASRPLPLLLTSATDGFVRVWDLASEREIDRIPINNDSGDGVWLDPERIAIGTSTGLWTTISIDRDELLDFALGRLQRSFTEQECETYRIDPCPTLDEIRSR